MTRQLRAPSSSRHRDDLSASPARAPTRAAALVRPSRPARFHWRPPAPRTSRHPPIAWPREPRVGTPLALRSRMREPLAHHVTMRLSTGRVLCCTAASRRRAARALYEQGEPHGLLSFRVADTHMHVLLACDRTAAGIFARLVETSLRARLSTPEPFEPARFTPVLDQSHLGSTFRYVMRQEKRHGTLADPFHDGSSLPDLIGARWLLAAPRSGVGVAPLGAATARKVAALLPRVRRVDLLAEVGVQGAGDVPSLDGLGDAAAAALGLDGIEGRGAARTLARGAAIHVAGAALSTVDLAHTLGISTRAVQQLRATPPHLGAIRAVAVQLRMRAVHRALPIEMAPLAPSP